MLDRILSLDDPDYDAVRDLSPVRNPVEIAASMFKSTLLTESDPDPLGFTKLGIEESGLCTSRQR